MTNQTIIEEVIHRIGREQAAKYGIQSMLRQMNVIYLMYNRKFKGAIKNSLSIAFDDDETDFTYTLPSDFLEPYKIDPEAVWRNPKVWDDSEAGTYTIDQGEIKFVAAAGLTFAVDYFSKGKTLVILDPGQSIVQGQVESPEWEDEDFHWLLMLALATRLAPGKYELYEQDLADRTELERQLKKQARVSQTSASPIIEGPLERRSSTEVNDYNPDEGNYFI